MLNIDSFAVNIQSDEMIPLEYQMDDVQLDEEYSDWTEEFEATQGEQIFIIGVVPMSNWGGFEIGEDESGDWFYRSNYKDYISEWEPLEIIEDNHGNEWAYNPDQYAYLFRMDEILRVGP